MAPPKFCLLQKPCRDFLSTATESETMKEPLDAVISPRRRQAAELLKRARQAPVGAYRNDLRQLAMGLRSLERQTPEAVPQEHAARSWASESYQGGTSHQG